MNYFNLAKKFIVFIGFFSFFGLAFSGSYEDFFKAVRRDDAQTVQALLQRGFDANTVSPDGLPGLLLAVREPSPKVVDLLIQWPHTKVEVRNDKDESVLMLAALKGQLAWVKKLVERDADVNKPGWTPLHYAASTGQVAIIEYLLDQSAYIDAESPNGTTPLMMAAMYGSPEAVKVLIQAGADLQAKNQLGMTALDFAVRGNRQNAKELIETGLARLTARLAQGAQTANFANPSSAATASAPANAASSPSTAGKSEPVSKPFKTGW